MRALTVRLRVLAGGAEPTARRGGRSGDGRGVHGRVPAAVLLVLEEMREGVRLVVLLAGVRHQVVHADELGGARVLAVRRGTGWRPPAPVPGGCAHTFGSGA